MPTPDIQVHVDPEGEYGFTIFEYGNFTKHYDPILTWDTDFVRGFINDDGHFAQMCETVSTLCFAANLATITGEQFFAVCEILGVPRYDPQATNPTSGSR